MESIQLNLGSPSPRTSDQDPQSFLISYGRRNSVTQEQDPNTILLNTISPSVNKGLLTLIPKNAPSTVTSHSDFSPTDDVAAFTRTPSSDFGMDENEQLKTSHRDIEAALGSFIKTLSSAPTLHMFLEKEKITKSPSKTVLDLTSTTTTTNNNNTGEVKTLPAQLKRVPLHSLSSSVERFNRLAQSIDKQISPNTTNPNVTTSSSNTPLSQSPT
jgi:hypothetical protein